jgi:hypothetical protein
MAHQTPASTNTKIAKPDFRLEAGGVVYELTAYACPVTTNRVVPSRRTVHEYGDWTRLITQNTTNMDNNLLTPVTLDDFVGSSSPDSASSRRTDWQVLRYLTQRRHELASTTTNVIRAAIKHDPAILLSMALHAADFGIDSFLLRMLYHTERNHARDISSVHPVASSTMRVHAEFSRMVKTLEQRDGCIALCASIILCGCAIATRPVLLVTCRSRDHGGSFDPIPPPSDAFLDTLLLHGKKCTNAYSYIYTSMPGHLNYDMARKIASSFVDADMIFVHAAAQSGHIPYAEDVVKSHLYGAVNHFLNACGIGSIGTDPVDTRYLLHANRYMFYRDCYSTISSARIL